MQLCLMTGLMLLNILSLHTRKEIVLDEKELFEGEEGRKQFYCWTDICEVLKIERAYLCELGQTFSVCEFLPVIFIYLNPYSSTMSDVH